MPSFVYRAVDLAGRTVNGCLDGDSEADALRALELRQLTPLTMRPAKNRRQAAAGRAEESGVRLSTAEIVQFTRQIKVMLGTGATLLNALALLHRRARGAYRTLLERISADIQRGATLSEALAAHPETFSPFYLGTIRAGEAAGVHAEAMDELVQFYERRQALRRDVIGALTYPAIVVTTLIAAAVVMLMFVIPQFEGMFRSSNVALPLPTRILIGASDLLTTHGEFLGIGLALAVGVVWWSRRKPRVRDAFVRGVSGLPFLGRVFFLASVIQFARMIALLERAGLPLLDTLKIVEDALYAGKVKTLTGNIRRAVIGGGSIAAAATADGPVLPEVVETALAVGEASGTIDQTLVSAATHYEDELRITIKRMTTALEPLLTMFVSGLVLLMALAIFLPLWEMNSIMLKH